MKKLFYGIIISCALMLIPTSVFATNAAKVGTTEYETFAEALTNVEEGGTITLISDVTIAATTINKDVVINLNNHTISAPRQTFTVQNASFELIGPGKVEETVPWFSPIVVKGSTTATDTNYTVVTIGKNVELVGYYGIMIDKTGYGVVINVNGNLKGVNDGSSDGTGLYINGTIADQTNYPIINVSKDAKIEADGSGIYAAGYAKWNLESTTVTAPTAIAIKAGILNVTGGVITATGDDETPTEPYNNGVNPSGAAIQVESNTAYSGDIEITLKNTKIVSQKGHAFYEYGNTDESYLIKLSLDNVSMTSKTGFDIFNVSDKFDLTGLVKVGKYSADVTKYVPAGYKSVFEPKEEMLVVTKVTVPTGNKTISGTITGTITDSVMSLKQGGLIIKKIYLTSNTYSIADVKAGIYNLVVENENVTVTKTVEVKDENVTFDFTMPAYSSQILVDGVNTPNVVVNGLDQFVATDNVAFVFQVLDEKELKESNDSASLEAIKELSKNKKLLLFDFSLLQEVATEFDPLEIVVPYDFSKNKNVVVYRYHDEEAQEFTKLAARPTEDYVDKTYYTDTTNNLLYIYSNNYSVYGIGSDLVANPDTSDNILLYVMLFTISALGTSIILKKKHAN